MASGQVIRHCKIFYHAHIWYKDAQELITALGTRITEQTGSDVDHPSGSQSLASSDPVDLHVTSRFIVICCID